VHTYERGREWGRESFAKAEKHQKLEEERGRRGGYERSGGAHMIPNARFPMHVLAVCVGALQINRSQYAFLSIKWDRSEPV
jgi:hypothetical protein